MAQEDFQIVWMHYLEKVKQCMEFKQMTSFNSQDALRAKTYQAFFSAILDLFNSFLRELAFSETLLACDNLPTTSFIIRTKSRDMFFKKIATMNSLITSKSSDSFQRHDIQQLFLTLSDLIELEQLESDQETLKAFSHILIASLLPLFSLCASQGILCDGIEELRTVIQLQSIAPSKRKTSNFTLLNSIIEAFALAEKSDSIFRNMCEGSNQEIHESLEAVAACVKDISDKLHENLLVSPLSNFDKQIVGERRIGNNFFNESKRSNIFLGKATKSLKSNVKMDKFSLNSKPKREGCKNFLFAYRLEEIIKKVLTESKRKTCQLTLTKLFSDHSLLDHIKALRSILLMQYGSVMEQFCSDISYKMKAVTRWNQESLLTLSLHNCMSSGRLTWFCEYLSVRLVDKSPKFDTGSLPELIINYKPPWPVSNIIQQKSLPLYTMVFQFLLKIKYSVAALQKLSFRELDKLISARKRLYWLRTWTMHFLSNVYSYFMECVLERLCVVFDEKAACSTHVEQLAAFHMEYICGIHHGCFLGQGSEFLNQPIREIANVALAIVSSWNGVVSENAIREMEEKFVYRYEYLVSVLDSAACRSKFQYVETLISSLNHKHPIINET